jgi:hypothetical protein
LPKNAARLRYGVTSIEEANNKRHLEDLRALGLS